MINKRTAAKILGLGIIVTGLILYSSKSAHTNAEAAFLAPIYTTPQPEVIHLSTNIDSREASEEMIRLSKFLDSRGSPMKNNSVDFVEAAAEYDIDPYLLPAISGVESSFGVHHLPGSHNSFGWVNGNHYFASYKEAIFTVAKTLREKYVRNGTEITPSKIGRTYATSWPTWIPKVERMRNTILHTNID